MMRTFCTLTLKRRGVARPARPLPRDSREVRPRICRADSALRGAHAAPQPIAPTPQVAEAVPLSQLRSTVRVLGVTDLMGKKVTVVGAGFYGSNTSLEEFHVARRCLGIDQRPPTPRPHQKSLAPVLD